MLRGEIRLCMLKPPDKRRPAVILTRDELIPHLSYVTVATITSTIRSTRAEVLLGVEDGMKLPCVINMHNIFTLNKQCIGPVVAILSERRLDQLRKAVHFAWGFDQSD